MCSEVKAAADQTFPEVLENIKEIRYNVENTAAKYRAGEPVRIMAVTKTVAPEKINFAVKNGFDLLGENRVQEYLSKKDFYEVTMIQSVDSLKLAAEIDRLAAKNGRVMNVLLEVNIGEEESKSGVSAKQLLELAEQAAELKNISIKGLMAIPPRGADESVFAHMHELFLTLKEKNLPHVSMETLSMGMSGDYELAIKHGSNLVRIGTGLFGARNYNTEG